jgi:site-specific recombinase XerD
VQCRCPASWLREFAATFPGHDVGDHSKEHLNAFIAAHARLSAKSRNDRRAVVRQFLKWCVRNDYLTMKPLTIELTKRQKRELQSLRWKTPKAWCG